jgi:hypothetical protein
MNFSCFRDYKNISSVTSQVNSFKSFPNLLTWYTADEPDGSSDDPSLSVAAYNTINTLDSSYHPTALVLNCHDYLFEGYVPGTDILMADPYPIGINATFSTVWGTAVTSDFGDCGCDDCVGNFTDVSERMDLFNQRLQVLGERKPVWAVPQGFGNDSCVFCFSIEYFFLDSWVCISYWSRNPTGQEFIGMSLLSISHGATGLPLLKIVDYTHATNFRHRFLARPNNGGHQIVRFSLGACTPKNDARSV